MTASIEKGRGRVVHTKGGAVRLPFEGHSKGFELAKLKSVSATPWGE